MPRLRDRRWRYEATIDATVALIMGPTDGPNEMTVDELAVAWEVERDRIMSAYGGPAGTRPWGFWQFDLGEPMPAGNGAEAVRLAELGLLTVEEAAALQERANESRLRLGTDREQVSGGNRETGVSMDRRHVDVWEAVERARP